MLQLDDHFRVSVDSSRQNFQLEQLQDVKDKKSKEVVRQEWSLIGFHGNSMRSVLLQYMKESLITDDKLETIHNVLDRLNEIENTIVKVVKKENIKLVAKQND
jgi:hypothetical protein